MSSPLRILVVQVAASLAALGALGAAAPVVPLYAIRGARVMTMAGAPIDNGTVVMRNGLIDDVGANVNVPADAIVIDGTGLTVYPGLIDMANSSALEPDIEGARSGGAPAAASQTLEDLERSRRVNLLKPDFEAARHTRFEGPEMQRLASAGITSVLVVPASGLIRGQSALVNVMAPTDDPQISNIGDYRRGLVVLKSPVASHIAFAAGSGVAAGGYPGSLLGIIAFIRQSLYDAAWQRDARAYAERHKDQPRPILEPVLDALAPVLEGKMPAAFEANQAVEIDRALGLAREFTLDPVIVGGAESGDVADDLKTAKARVIYSLNFPPAPGAGGRGGAAAAEETLRAMRVRMNAPKGPAALLKAGVPFAFTSGGLANLGDFVRNAAKTVRDGGLPADAALTALTSGAARMAGVGDRLGAIEKGKIANIIAVDGDLLSDGARVRHVYIDGRPIDVDMPAPATGGGRGRGGLPTSYF